MLLIRQSLYKRALPIVFRKGFSNRNQSTVANICNELCSLGIANIRTCDDRTFSLACIKGQLDIAKWIITSANNDISVPGEELFREVCRSNQSNQDSCCGVAKWIYSFGSIDINLAFNIACECNNVEIAKWLHFLGNVNIHDRDELLFRDACRNGHIQIVKLLYSLGANIHEHNDHAFRSACANGHLEVAQLLYSLGFVDISYDREDAFRWACHNGHLDIIVWLYSLNRINIHIENDWGLVWACCNDRLAVIQWLVMMGCPKKSSNFKESYIKQILKQTIPGSKYYIPREFLPKYMQDMQDVQKE